MLLTSSSRKPLETRQLFAPLREKSFGHSNKPNTEYGYQTTKSIWPHLIVSRSRCFSKKAFVAYVFVSAAGAVAAAWLTPT